MKKILKFLVYALTAVFLLFMISGFLGAVADGFIAADLTDGSIDGAKDTLSWAGFGVGFIALLLICIVGATTLWVTSTTYRWFTARKHQRDNQIHPRNPATKKKIVAGIAILAILLWSALAIIKAQNGNQDLAKSDKSNERMPSLISSSLSDAEQKLDDLNVDLDVRTEDLLQSRSVWNEDNWTVVSQSPAAGVLLDNQADVCIGIVKNDEAWKTHRQLQCWSESDSELDALDDNYELKLKDLLTVTSLPPSLDGYHLRATVKIEMDGGNTVSLPYCTYSMVSSNSAMNLKLDASDGGDPGLFADGGQSFKAGLFLNWTGRYRYSITKLEKSRTSKCG